LRTLLRRLLRDRSSGEMPPAPTVVHKWLSPWYAFCQNANCRRNQRVLPLPARKTRGFLVEDRWFCSPGCAQDFLLYRVHSLLSRFRPAGPRHHRVPIGHLLLNRGVLEQEKLREALRFQKEHAPMRLGDCLVALGLASEMQIASALSQQWACPFYPLESQPAEFLPFSVAPLEVFRASRSVPAYLSPDGRALHVAFCDRIDHTTLYGLETMLECHTQPSVATASAVAAALDYRAATAARQEPFFETVRDPRDVSAILASYAVEVRAARLRLVRTQHHLWGRLFRKGLVRDVLFQLPAPGKAAPPLPTSPAAEAVASQTAGDEHRADPLASISAAERP